MEKELALTKLNFFEKLLEKQEQIEINKKSLANFEENTQTEINLLAKKQHDLELELAATKAKVDINHKHSDLLEKRQDIMEKYIENRLNGLDSNVAYGVTNNNAAQTQPSLDTHEKKPNASVKFMQTVGAGLEMNSDNLG